MSLKIKKSYAPKVSVIIPTYNRSWIIGKAINSVLQQDYSNIEIIVIDDGSIDNTIEVLKKYGSKIKLIKQKNTGVSASRNIGIKNSKGEFIAFLDSDDHWFKKKISIQIDFFKKNPDALICQTEEIWMKNNKRINQGKRHKKPSGMIFKQCLELCLVSPSAVMIKKILFKQVGLFNEELIACEDYDLWLRISYSYPIYLIDKPLITKTGGHKDQLSKTPKLDKFRIRAIKHILENGKLTTKQRSHAIKTLKKKCIIYLSGCIKRGKYIEAQQIYKILSKYHSSFLSKNNNKKQQ